MLGTGFKRGFVFGLLMLISSPVLSQEKIVLWPQGAPGAKGTEEKDQPSITAYLPAADKATGAAIVICPGGGYGHLAVGHEGEEIGQWLKSLGVAGFVLR